jgi:hypothetical protein
MGIRTAALHALAVLVLGWTTTAALHAQKPSGKTQREIQTATTARADFIAGRLNPEHSKPGDTITLRLTEDVKSNGLSVLPKGTELTATVRRVVQKDGSKPGAGRALSMIELEWLRPLPTIPNVRQLMITLQSFTHIASEAPVTAIERTPVDTAVLPDSASEPRPNGKSNPALMSMPFIVAADERTTFALEQDFDFPSEEQMYRTGRGDMLNPDGERESVELFSRLANDNVITSNNRLFDVTPGAKMQLLVGVQRK